MGGILGAIGGLLGMDSDGMNDFVSGAAGQYNLLAAEDRQEVRDQKKRDDLTADAVKKSRAAADAPPTAYSTFDMSNSRWSSNPTVAAAWASYNKSGSTEKERQGYEITLLNSMANALNDEDGKDVNIQDIRQRLVEQTMSARGVGIVPGKDGGKLTAPMLTYLASQATPSKWYKEAITAATTKAAALQLMRIPGDPSKALWLQQRPVTGVKNGKVELSAEEAPINSINDLTSRAATWNGITVGRRTAQGISADTKAYSTTEGVTAIQNDVKYYDDNLTAVEEVIASLDGFNVGEQGFGQVKKSISSFVKLIKGAKDIMISKGSTPAARKKAEDSMSTALDRMELQGGDAAKRYQRAIKRLVIMSIKESGLGTGAGFSNKDLEFLSSLSGEDLSHQEQVSIMTERLAKLRIRRGVTSSYQDSSITTIKQINAYMNEGVNSERIRKQEMLNAESYVNNNYRKGVSKLKVKPATLGEETPTGGAGTSTTQRPGYTMVEGKMVKKTK